MKTTFLCIFLIVAAVLYGSVFSAEPDFEAFIDNFEQISLPNTIPSKDINTAGIKPELTQKYFDPTYPVVGNRGDGFYSVGAYGLLKKTDNYIAIIIHTKKHTAEKYFLATYSTEGKKISEVMVAKFPESLTTARMLTAAISENGNVNVTGTDEILIEGEGYKDIEMDITYVIMDDGTIATDESTNPEGGSINGCDDEEVQRIDEMKFTIAHQLINAKTVNATLEDGTGITAFYVDSDLVKLSIDASGFAEEIYVSGGYPICFEVTTYGSDPMLTEHYYFKDNKLVCREVPMTGERSGPPEEPETDLIVGFEHYLTAIQ